MMQQIMKPSKRSCTSCHITESTQKKFRKGSLKHENYFVRKLKLKVFSLLLKTVIDLQLKHPILWNLFKS